MLRSHVVLSIGVCACLNAVGEPSAPNNACICDRWRAFRPNERNDTVIYFVDASSVGMHMCIQHIPLRRVAPSPRNAGGRVLPPRARARARPRAMAPKQQVPDWHSASAARLEAKRLRAMGQLAEQRGLPPAPPPPRAPRVFLCGPKPPTHLRGRARAGSGKGYRMAAPLRRPPYLFM